MNSITNIGQLFQEVKSSINIEEVATRLGSTLSRQGSTLTGTCPIGHTSSSKKSFHIDNKKQLCHCFNCGIGGDAISLVEKVNKVSSWEALKWLVAEFNLKIDLGQHQHIPKPSPEEIKANNELRSRSFLLEQIVERGKQLLYQDEGEEALEYLTGERGYDLEILKDTEWFYLPKEYEAKTELINGDDEKKEIVGKLKLQGHFGDNFRLAFPYRNSEGLITGFLKRAVEKNGITVTTYDNKVHEGVRWDSTAGLIKDDLFGLDKVDDDEDTIIVVEGYPDALYLRAMGIKNIVAVGQGKLGEKHLEGLRERKIKNVIISFDNDDVGPKNTEGAVRLLLENSNITPYVIDPKEYGASKDPDEYFKAKGFPMLKNVFDTKVEDGVVWIVKGLIINIEDKSAIEKKDIKEKILELLTLVKDGSTITEVLELIKSDFKETVQSLKRQLKGKRKDYKEELVDHVTNDLIVPFLDDNSGKRAYYNAKRDVLNLGIDKEFIKELMLDYGLRAPESYPSFTVQFEPLDLSDKFNLREKTFNLFSPTDYMFLEKNKDVIDLQKSCPSIHTVICNVVPEKSERERFINWLSYTFCTREKSIVAWLFRGTQGTGKNLLFEQIITPLWGDNQCSIVDNSALDRPFNPYMRNKMMIAYNEVTTDYRSDKKEKESKIKAYITDSKVTINEKNIGEYELQNYSNSFFFSNYEVPLIIQEDDRRFNVVENKNKLENNPNYKKYKTHVEFLNVLHSELSSFAQYLINYNYDETKANRVFMNDAKQKIIGSSMSMFEEFAKKLIAKDYEWLRDESGVFPKNNWDLETVKDGYIFKDVAVDVFNRLYNKNFISPNILSKQLQHYGIKIDGRVKINNERVSAYTWK